ncbi:amidohydrolase family protein [Nocardioides sp. SOB44]|uniref:Amidohydrolase family protein n=1 Tax=Nocardioides cremeus TaxID=3058044 RepID=A0ABT8TRR8_9ACTN|nr:amidohydrolase family protein [Nocardioides cremeus]MDO3396029.1 amidohydrolase family protein [Nocardioides cremeus]
MSALKFSGPVLPDGGSRDLYVVDGRVTFEPQPGAETAARGWIVPGLVDAHNHLGMEDHGAVGDDEVEGQALADRDAGALLLRDCGSPADTRWVHERDDLPRLVRAGRHIARTRRYIRNYAHEVEPEELSAYVAQEAQAGDGWVKLVGDWISRDAGDLAPSFPQESFAEAIEVAHRHGAKVTAHCFGHDVLQGLLDAGIDCIEHGTGLALEQVEQMAVAGVALVPTVMQTDKFPEFAAQGREKFPAYAGTMDQLHARRREVLMSAHEAGVALYVGSDGGGAQRHGHLAGEVLAMAQLGMPAADVLAAASWKAREWLGFEGLVEGASADFVVYDRDPAQDLTALWEPACVVLRGRVVA